MLGLLTVMEQLRNGVAKMLRERSCCVVSSFAIKATQKSVPSLVEICASVGLVIVHSPKKKDSNQIFFCSMIICVHDSCMCDCVYR